MTFRVNAKVKYEICYTLNGQYIIHPLAQTLAAPSIHPLLLLQSEDSMEIPTWSRYCHNMLSYDCKD